MLFGLFKRDAAADAAAELYRIAVDAARQPALYADVGVEDSVEGRFELVLLHSALLVRRLAPEGAAGQATGRAVAEAFFADMDRTLREMGVGDLSVPKKMKKISEAFYGRLGAYDAAITAGDAEALRRALARNIFGREDDGAGETGAAALAAYVAAAAAGLAATPADALLAGRAAFPAAGGAANGKELP